MVLIRNVIHLYKYTCTYSYPTPTPKPTHAHTHGLRSTQMTILSPSEVLVSHQKAEFTHCTPPGGTLYLDVCECHPFDCHRPEVSNLQCATWFCYWNTATSIHL